MDKRTKLAIDRSKFHEPWFCKYGYTEIEIAEIVDDVEDFNHWMRGQTMAICCASNLNPCAEEHGVVVYPWDLERYLCGLPIID